MGVESLHIDLPNMIVTAAIQLGGPASPFALGPMPIGLFLPAMVPGPLPGPLVPFPLSVQVNADSVNPAHWGL